MRAEDFESWVSKEAADKGWDARALVDALGGRRVVLKMQHINLGDKRKNSNRLLSTCSEAVLLNLFRGSRYIVQMYAYEVSPATGVTLVLEENMADVSWVSSSGGR